MAELDRSRRLDAVFAQAPVAIMLLVGPDFTIEQANPLAERLWGTPGGEAMVGRPIGALQGIAARHAIVELLESVRKSGQPRRTPQVLLELPTLGGDVSEPRYFDFSYEPLSHEFGDAILVVGTDVTESVRLTERRKDEFLATLAHELRNPMAAISTAMSLLERVDSDSPQAVKCREMARRQMMNLVQLVDDLLDVARINRGSIELRRAEVDLIAVVQSALSVTRPLIEMRGHELLVTLAPAPFRMEGDATRLEQIVQNLLTNAAKYTGPGGRISVSLAQEDSDGGKQAVLCVRDNGRGIPEGMLDKVFDLFTQVSPTLDRSSGGLGIGLTIVKKLVALHGGSVVAASGGAGQGSEFVVRLPLSSPPADPQRATDPVAAPLPQSRRIVLVEDSQDVRDIMVAYLECLGHDVAAAKDGQEGLERVLALRPDVAIIDVGLPKLDGYEVARRIRAQTAGESLYLVALTGYSGPEVQAKAEAAGFDLQLTKPIDVDILPEVLKRSSQRGRPRHS
jgi:signal transduction histidine kinase/CheY-like chemotaxis protein